MPKDVPDCPKRPNLSPAVESRSYHVELITPMFGGGVEPRVNDSAFPIRTTAIRGQLQFWWRATAGARCPTVEELRAAQTQVWGSTERASRVQVSVESVRAEAPEPCARFRWDPNASRGRGRWHTDWQPPFNGRDSALPYALFPFQGETPHSNPNAQITAPPAMCIRRASFQLVIRCPKDLWGQIEPAVWAWTNFGGLGGRTRRGCGTILCADKDKQLAPRDHANISEQFKRFAPQPHEVRAWPTLPQSVHVCERSGPPVEVWNWVIGLFKHFRQGIDFARDPGPGRSRYPESEVVRTVLYNPARPWRHARLDHVPNDAFPRAELGLPIVFHFQGQDEPPDTVLYPCNGADGKPRERMASPLILKPLALANGQAIPLILRLRCAQLEGVDLRRGDTSLPLPPTATIRDPQLASYRDSPLAASPIGSAIEAFLAFARTAGFTEVSV